jgi:hypothetical protein
MHKQLLDNFSLPSKAAARDLMKHAGMYAGIFIVLYIAGTFLPAGFDWRIFFSKGTVPSFWVPWVEPILKVINLPALFALTIMGIGLRTLRYRQAVTPLLLAIVSLPTLWVLFLGNLDGLILVGLLLLPWGVPLVLIKPQIAAFALLARWKWLIAAVIWFVISIMIWGLWPLEMLVVFEPGWKEEWVQDITLFPWGLIIALPLLWFSRGDEDLLMAAGSLATPHLFPYHFIVLMPAIARMSMFWMLLTWLLSWSPLMANWLGPWAWHLGNLMSVSIWIGVYLQNRRTRADADSKTSEMIHNV